MVAEKKIMNTFLSIEEKYEELAKDLHDGISQQLVTMLWKIEELHGVHKEEELRKELATLGDYLREVIADLQRIIYGIKPVLIDQLGLQEGINVWVSRQFSLQNINFELKKYPYPVNLSRFESGQIFRIIQEGVNNIIRHAQANHVTLNFEKEQGNLIITLIDDGRGFQPDNEAVGLGIKLINERAVSIQSDVQIKSQLGGGTVLKIIIPYKGDDER